MQLATHLLLVYRSQQLYGVCSVTFPISPARGPRAASPCRDDLGATPMKCITGERSSMQEVGDYPRPLKSVSFRDGESRSAGHDAKMICNLELVMRIGWGWHAPCLDTSYRTNRRTWIHQPSVKVYFQVTLLLWGRAGGQKPISSSRICVQHTASCSLIHRE